MAAWIELEDVHLSRGGRPVLRELTARLEGQAIGLVGANGAGKSTLIGALLGVLAPDRGTVRVLGHVLPGGAMEVRARAGVMAEQAGIFPGGSGVDAVAFAGMLSGLPRREALRRAHRALDALGVDEERYRDTSGYSTGMRQRCKLAMSLVHDPEVLVLDEPTVGLDPPGRESLLRLIRELRDGGRRILLSTHIMPDAEFVCDEMLLLEGGTIAYAGPLRGLVGEPRQTLLARGRGLGEELAAALVTAGLGATVRPDGALVLDLPGDDGLRTFWRLAAAAGAEVRTLAPEVRSLEEAVVAAMEGRDGRNA